MVNYCNIIQFSQNRLQSYCFFFIPANVFKKKLKKTFCGRIICIYHNFFVPLRRKLIYFDKP